MSEYIEWEKAIEEIDSWLDSVGSIIVGKGLSSYGELIGCIQDVPAADVQEVRHGRWIATEKYMIDECSDCGFEIDWDKLDYLDVTISDIRFCPYCGAKMYGKEQEMDNLKERRSDGNDGQQ